MSAAPVGFPRPVLIAVGGMLALVVGVAALGRSRGASTEIPASTAVATRDLRFSDRADGAVVITEAPSDRLVSVVTGQAGFLRATMRGLAQERMRGEADGRPPFRLTQWADGRLTLDDPVTRRHVELEAFGETNEAVFASLLTAGPPAVASLPAADGAKP